MAKGIGLYRELLRFNARRSELADKAVRRSAMTPEEAKRVAKMPPDKLVREVVRRWLLATVAGLPEMKRVITAQAKAEVEALQHESPHTLEPLTDKAVAEEQAREAAPAPTEGETPPPDKAR